MLHITPKASAYLENIWAWAADHDIDSTHQSSIDIYTARGVLIESTGPTWLWGTTVEHCVLYQYQLTGARKVIIGMLQTESPYFQPRPPSPKPFQDQLGAFFDDPGLGSYNTNSSVYDSAWGLRVIDSSTIYVLTGGLSSRYRDYSPECVGSGAKRSCQDGIFYTEQSSDIWMYNLITTGTAEMISPHMEEPVLAAPNRNGLASTLLSWHGGINGTTGQRDFDGYVLYSPESLDGMKSFSPACQKALQAKINCHDLTHSFRVPRYHGVLENSEIKLSWVCNNGCQESIDQWVHSVETFCNGTAWPSNAPAEYLGGYIQYGLKEQCQKDQKTGEYCNGMNSLSAF